MPESKPQERFSYADPAFMMLHRILSSECPRIAGHGSVASDTATVRNAKENPPPTLSSLSLILEFWSATSAVFRSVDSFNCNRVRHLPIGSTVGSRSAGTNRKLLFARQERSHRCRRPSRHPFRIAPASALVARNLPVGAAVPRLGRGSDCVHIRLIQQCLS